jgi:hypothetical protein
MIKKLPTSWVSFRVYACTHATFCLKSEKKEMSKVRSVFHGKRFIFGPWTRCIFTVHGNGNAHPTRTPWAVHLISYLVTSPKPQTDSFFLTTHVIRLKEDYSRKAARNEITCELLFQHRSDVCKTGKLARLYDLSDNIAILSISGL